MALCVFAHLYKSQEFSIPSNVEVDFHSKVVSFIKINILCTKILWLLQIFILQAPDLNLCQLSQQLKMVDVRLPGLVIKR